MINNVNEIFLKSIQTKQACLDQGLDCILKMGNIISKSIEDKLIELDYLHLQE